MTISRRQTRSASHHNADPKLRSSTKLWRTQIRRALIQAVPVSYHPERNIAARSAKLPAIRKQKSLVAAAIPPVASDPDYLRRYSVAGIATQKTSWRRLPAGVIFYEGNQLRRRSADVCIQL